MTTRTTDESADQPTACDTRAQSMPGGNLIDISKFAGEAGLNCPVAITRAAWADCVAWSDSDNERKGTLQDEAGRLSDVVSMCKIACRNADEGTPVMPFEVHRVPRAGCGTGPLPVKLAAEVDVDERGVGLTIGHLGDTQANTAV